MGETYKDLSAEIVHRDITKRSKPERPRNTSVCLEEHNEYLKPWLFWEPKIVHLILPRQPGNMAFDSASALHWRLLALTMGTNSTRNQSLFVQLNE